MASYWRNSLADAELGKGGWHEPDLANTAIRPRFELINASLDRQVTDEFFRSEPAEIQAIEVAFHPILFKLKTEHGSRKQYALPSLISPIVVKARLRRDGAITPLPKIYVTRDLLEPLERNSFSIGHIDDLDIFLTSNPSPVPANVLHIAQLAEQNPHRDEGFDIASGQEYLERIWKQLLPYCEAMLDHVCKDDMINANGYLRAREWMIRKIGGSDNPSKRISSLYDHLRQANPHVPLFDAYASLEASSTEALLPTDSAFDVHVGHCSDSYPLAKAQRDAMTHTLAMTDGEMLAVNGPPGTGKTTLVLSVVANYWVQAAIDQSEAPIIVASSANNQSVTNILDSFRKAISTGNGVYSGRWISGIDGFGIYLSSWSKRQQTGGKYLSSDFLMDFESVDSVAQARDDFLSKARLAFPELTAPSVSTVVTAIHQAMLGEQQRLSEIKSAYDQLKSLQETLSKALGQNHWETLQRFDNEAEEAKKRHKVFENAYINLINHLGTQPFWYDLLKFIPVVSRKQGVRASIVVKRTIRGIPPDKIWESVDNLKATLLEKTKSLKAHADRHQKRQRKAHALVRHIANAKNRLSTAYKAVMDLDQIDIPKEPASLYEANVAADTRIRFKLFLLATHYWEGRWLLSVDGQEASLLEAQGKQTPEVIIQRWRRRMMLTPCAVSTCFMLPTEFRVLHDDDPHRHSYLYNSIDLLIMDEAGQVLPEVAGACFSLAKKALVIGDTHQIEPIWSIPKSVDIGNMIQHGVISDSAVQSDIETIVNLGKSASCGNVMRIAQLASRYHYDDELARGMYLYEHRRCFNEIIAFCNALSYKNKLIPARGRRSDLEVPPNQFPPMGYIDVHGQCKTKSTGTRFNTIEANAIADWIIHNKKDLEAMYSLPIEQIIGVVTPFTGQVDALRTALRRVGIDVSNETGMTVGTVHSLQGAERRIVLFSPTYSKENNGGFIDASPSMLNVAVSRARDNFIVVGDMRLFNHRQAFTPRGLLATFLYKHEENRIKLEKIVQ